MDTDYDTNSEHELNNIYEYIPLNYDDLKSHQKLFLILINIFYLKKYKKVNDIVYKEIYSGPHNTHAWEHYDTILSAVHNECTMTKSSTNWTLMTVTNNNDKNISHLLEKTHDPRFPTLYKQRSVFSFQNGIYFCLAKLSGLEQYMDSNEPLFIEYNSAEYKQIPSDIISAKYHDNPFDINNTNTPLLDKILEDQELTEDVRKWVYILLGRCLYNLCDLDEWQVIPFFIGYAGTGKSTILNLFKMIYDNEDVGILSNNFQTTFGLSDIYDKWLWIGPEIKQDLKIDQAEFQEMVSGGNINVNIKHEKSKQVKWRIPGILAGNENPGFVDNSDSIGRRILPIRFDHKIQKPNPNMQEDIKKELPQIIHKINTLYLEYAHKYRGQGIWDIVPQTFVTNRDLMVAATNPFVAFLTSDKVVLDKTTRTPLDKVRDEFEQYRIKCNFGKSRWTREFYKPKFDEFCISLEKKQGKDWVIGLKIVNTDYEEEF